MPFDMSTLITSIGLAFIICARSRTVTAAGSSISFASLAVAFHISHLLQL
jgi:hypothetical protein